jgi:hypothetical protein
MLAFLTDVPLRPLLAYLAPAVLLAVALLRWGRANFAFAMVAFPGTLAHELLHFTVGFFVGARPVRLSLWPRRASNGSYVFGVVVFENLRWWNAAPASLAPLMGFAIEPALAWLRVRHGYRFESADVAIWFGLGQLLASAWPSMVDWKLSLRSWPFALIGTGTAVLHYVQH